MEESKKKNKTIYIIIVSLILVAILFAHLFTDYPRSIYKKVKAQYKTETIITQKQLDSARNASIEAKKVYQEQLSAMQEMYEQELNDINEILKSEIRKKNENAKELKAYRDGDFHKRYDVFTTIYDFNPKD